MELDNRVKLLLLITTKRNEDRCEQLAEVTAWNMALFEAVLSLYRLMQARD